MSIRPVRPISIRKPPKTKDEITTDPRYNHLRSKIRRPSTTSSATGRMESAIEEYFRAAVASKNTQTKGPPGSPGHSVGGVTPRSGLSRSATPSPQRDRDQPAGCTLAVAEFGLGFVNQHVKNAEAVRASRACGLLGALLMEYGSIEAIPPSELSSAQAVTDYANDTTAFMKLMEELAKMQRGGEWGNLSDDGLSPRDRSRKYCKNLTLEKHRRLLDKRMRFVPEPPQSASAVRPEGKSKLRAYIRARPASAKAGLGKEETANLRRVLNEIQLRLPALKRLQQQHNVDPDSEAGQVLGFGDVFTLLDEDGSGAVDLGEFVSFGRRVGGESTKVFSKATFHRIDSTGKGEIDKDGFISVLFPSYAARKKKQLEEATARRRREKEVQALKWEDMWIPEDLDHAKMTFARCDRDDDGLVSFDDFATRCRMDWADARANIKAQFDSLDSDGDGLLNLREFCDLMKPGFDAGRERKEPDQKLFFQHIKAGW